MSEIKLKRCPFCGKEAKFCSKIALSKGEYTRMYGVMCENSFCCCIRPQYYTQEQAIEKWNTRKPMQEIVERLEECSKIARKDYEIDVLHGLRTAIEIVKEVGGMNE